MGFNETINPDSIDAILTSEPTVRVPTLHVRVNRFQLGHSLTRGGTSSCIAAPASSARIESIALEFKLKQRKRIQSSRIPKAAVNAHAAISAPFGTNRQLFWGGKREGRATGT
jgi:hypothetical protein